MPILPGPDTGTPGSGTVQPWATVADVCAPCNDYGFDETILENCLQFASEVLFNFTGRRWPGEQSDLIRPCRRSGMVARIWGSDGTGWACSCNHPRSCGCSALSEIRLPGSPVTAINYVKIDGEMVDPASYRLDDHRWLVWLGDDDVPRRGWPCCQRLDLPDSEDDTFTVSYTFGHGPDQGGVMAAASLACQLALAFGAAPDSDKKCRLPRRVTSIARQGVTIAVLDPLTLFKEGQTGLSEVDMWIASKMLGAKNRRATAFRIGRGRAARRTGV